MTASRSSGSSNDGVSVEEIQKRVNDRYDAMFHDCPDGSRVPYVCAICDEFIITQSNKHLVTSQAMQKMEKLLSWQSLRKNARPRALEEHFRFDISKSSIDDPSEFQCLEKMALSPRGVIEKATGRGSGKYKCKFVVCKRCHGCVSNVKLPRHAIVNCNYVGGAPACLMELTEVERAFLSPVKGHGFCFTYIGGKQRNLKGTMTFMRVEKREVVKGVVTLQEMGFNDHVLCLFGGHMTAWQKNRAKEQCTIRTAKIYAAVDFLVAMNPRWSRVNAQELQDSPKNKRPVIYDNSKDQESENSNVEQQEVFTCYYPDGATSPTNGGFEKPDSFKEYVEEMARKGFKVEFQAEHEKKFVSDGDAEILLDACLLQFPYGVGHMNEERQLQDGSWTEKSDLIEYLQHLSKLSQPCFQTNFFQLVLYSLASKTWLLHSSRLSLRGKTDAKNLAENLTLKDVKSCINGRRLGNRGAGTNASKALLNAVDATSRSLPHTDAATRRERGNMEAMQHHMGMASLFVTATFDDENSFLMQVMLNDVIDDDVPVDSLSDA